MNRAATRSLQIIGRIWRGLPSPIRRRALFATNHHFLVGVVGVIRNEDGRVLLLNHRFRTPYGWGLPGGFIHHGESLGDALTRELREEINLAIEPRHVVDTELNREGRYVSVAIVARTIDPTPDLAAIHHPEILSGGFFSASDLPPTTYPHHRRLLQHLDQEVR